MKLAALFLAFLVLGSASHGLAQDLETRRDSALALLLATDEFSSPFVDAAGVPSYQAMAFGILFHSEERELLFRQLIAEAKPAGQLYGLTGLRLVSRRDYRAVASPFLEDSRDVQTHRGCRVAIEPVAGVAKEIDSGYWPRAFRKFMKWAYRVLGPQEQWPVANGERSNNALKLTVHSVTVLTNARSAPDHPAA